MKKRILCLMITLLLLLNVLPITVLAEELGAAISAASDSEKPQATIEAQQTYYSEDPELFTNSEGVTSAHYAKPDASGTVYLDIKLDKAPESQETVTVYYETQDLTAIAETGDYAAVSNSVRLSPENNYSATVAVQTSRTTFATTWGTGKYSDDPFRETWWVDSAYTSRCFDVILTDIEGGDALISEDGSKVRCALLAENTIEICEDYFLAYSDLGYVQNKLGVAYIDTRSKPIDGKGSITQDLEYVYPVEWYEGLVKTGLAYPVVSGRTTIDEHWWGTVSKAYLTFYYHINGEKHKAFRLEYQGEFDLSNASQHVCCVAFATPFVWWLDEKDNYSALENDRFENNYSAFGGLEIYNHDGSVALRVNGGEYDSDEAMLHTIEQYKNFVEGSVAGYISGAWAKVPEQILAATGYSYEFSSESGWDRVLYDGEINLRVHDSELPELIVDERGNKGIYTNFDTVKVGEKLRLMLRFNEPVRLSGDTKISTLLNGNADYPAVFKFIGGSGSDTLCFEADFDAAIKVSTITIESFSSAIEDFSYDATTKPGNYDSVRILHKWDWMADLGTSMTNLNLDARIPTVIVTKRPDSNGRYAASTSVGLNIGSNGKSFLFSNPVTLHYSWSDSPELPDTYDTSVVIDPSVKPNMDYDIIGVGDGMKYLHIKVVSKYGRESIADKSNSSGSYIPGVDAAYTPYGPYYFDNTPPELPSAASNPSANGNERTYAFKRGDITDLCGIAELSLWYVAADGTEKRLYAYAFTDADGPDMQIEKKITNESVGVGADGKKERRDVTLFWIAKDRVGNSHRTAYHTENFDTNDYMQLHIVSPQRPDTSVENDPNIYYDHTERVDSTTFIYSYGDNANRGTGGVYFELFFAPNYQAIDSTITDEDWSQYSFIIKGSQDGEQTVVAYNEATSSFTVMVYDEATGSFIPAEGGGYSVVEATETDDDGITERDGLSLRFMTEPQNGYYDIYVKRTDSNANERITITYRVYVTEAESDETENGTLVDRGTLLSNSVYSLSTIYPHYYYMDANKNVVSTCYCKSGTHSTADEASKCIVVPTFSSYNEAKLFVYYHELLDLYPITLTEADARNLNSGITMMVKALEDRSILAEEGQTWIRYKSSSWVPSAKSTEWVYYYYSSNAAESISESALPGNLKAALNSVSTTIAGLPEQLKQELGSAEKGGHLFLTDASLLAGSDTVATLLDKNGVPYLNPAKIHSDPEISIATMCGTPFTNAVKYDGDPLIYNAKIYEDAGDGGPYLSYTIIGNMHIPVGSRYQYARDPSGPWIDIEWNGQTSTTFGEVLPSHGIYYLRVLSDDGVSTLNVYVDAVAPDIYVSWTDKSGLATTTVVDTEHDKNFRAKTFTITGFGGSELDDGAYIAVYKSSGALYNVYSKEDLEEGNITLPDGNFSVIVADRSGNRYTLSVRINVSELQCRITEKPNSYIELSCDNREAGQILYFRITHNGLPITRAFDSKNRFTEGGIYTFYVEDIYGNVYEDSYTFKREYPSVDWRYDVGGGSFALYDEDRENPSLKIVETAPGHYSLTSATRLRFSFSEDYQYEFDSEGIGGIPTQNTSGVCTVPILANRNFRLKVYYSDHPDVYSIYDCTFDMSAPVISASFDIYEVEQSELSALMAAVSDNPVGTVLTPSTFLYDIIEANKSIRFISDGQMVTTNLIYINVSDASGVESVTVYWNGEEIIKRTAAEGYGNIVASRKGSYRVVARDILGNESEMNFANDGTSTFDLYVDGEACSTDISSYIDPNSSERKYGSRSFVIKVYENLDVFYMITDSEGRKLPLILRVEDGRILLKQYVVATDGDGNKALALIESADALFDSTDPSITVGRAYTLEQAAAYGFEVYALVEADGSISIGIRAPEDADATHSVEARLITDNNDYYYLKAELSKKISEIELTDENGQTIPAGTDGSEIKVNEFFGISFTEEDKIALVEVFFSTRGSLSPEDTAGMQSIFAPGVSYDMEGFYLIRVRNLYGNELIYRLALANSMLVTSRVEYADGQQLLYSNSYEGTLCSNASITLEIHATDVTVSILKGGSTAPSSDYTISEENGITYVTVKSEGIFAVSVRDAYSNTRTFSLDIRMSESSFNEELLYGYDLLSPGKSSSYTKNKLSVSREVFERDGLTYFAIAYNGEITVLYDGLSEPLYDENGAALEPYVLTDSDLIEIVGSMGDGAYTLSFRNKYGNLVSKLINYRESPTLVLHRQTRGDASPVEIDIADAVANGLWSNGSLYFSSDAGEYVFTVNGAKNDCPKTLTFTSADEMGSFEYDITYSDEYGFSFSFKAHLIRRELDVKPSPEMSGKYIDDVLTTKGGISVIFSESATCTYSVNGGEALPYTTGDKLWRDGLYRFVVGDLAGNVSTITLKRDTIAEFRFVESGTQNEIINGGAVNSSKVSLNVLNNDSVYIKKVFLDDVLLEDYQDTKFSEDGKWELLLSDELDNEAYFCFHIISSPRNGFSYTTPYEYKVAEAWYDSGDGVSVSYLQFVNHTDYNSSLFFKENGVYTILMRSDITGATSEFNVTVNTVAPTATLVGCNVGETTLNDVTLAGCKVGEVIRVYRKTDLGRELIEEIEVNSDSTPMPVISDGGEYTIVVESEAGVETELSFVRKHVMNTAGSAFVLIMIGVAVAALFAGLIYRNKSKTDN